MGSTIAHAQTQKSIKKDPELYQEFQSDKQWGSWRSNTLAIARLHDIAKVFDATFTVNATRDPEEAELLVYAVFLTKLLTDQGKFLLKKHNITFDAQAEIQ